MASALSIVALVTIAATVYAVDKPVMDTEGNNLNVRMPRDGLLTLTRRNTVDVSGLEGRLSALESNAEIFAYKATMNASSQMMGSIVNSMTTLKNDQDQFKSDLEGSVQQKMTELAAMVDTFKQNATKNQSAFEETMNEEFTKATTDLLQQVEDASQKMQVTTAGQLKTMTDSINDLKSSLTSLSASVGEKHIWIGGSTNHIRHGWRDFLLQREEFNTGAPYFKREGNRFRVLKDGFYRLQYGGIMHGGWCHNHMEVWVNGKRIRDSTHNYVPGTWQNAEFETTWFVKANQQMWFRVYGCNYFNHGSGGYDAHNRLVFEYVGAKGKCSGKYCNGI